MIRYFYLEEHRERFLFRVLNAQEPPSGIHKLHYGQEMVLESPSYPTKGIWRETPLNLERLRRHTTEITSEEAAMLAMEMA